MIAWPASLPRVSTIRTYDMDNHGELRRGEKTNTRVQDEERRLTRGFTTRREDQHADSRRARGDTMFMRNHDEKRGRPLLTPQARSIRKVRGRETERGMIRHGGRPPEVPQRRLPPTSGTTGSRREETATRMTVGQGQCRRSMEVCPEQGCSQW